MAKGYKINRVNGFMDSDMGPMIRKLEKKVNNDIANGWKPLGGVNAMMGKNLFQAMIIE